MMHKIIEVREYKRRKKGGSKKTVTVKTHKRSRKLTSHEYTELGFRHLIKSGFFSEEQQNKMRGCGKVKELKNTETEVELINKEGKHLRWVFKKYPDEKYYAVLFVVEEFPEPHNQLIKEKCLGADKVRAVRGWNSIIRHRRDLNEQIVSSEVSKEKT